MEKEKYSEEFNVGVRVVHMACSLCQKVQKGLLGKAFGDDGEVKSKDDDSLVTIAGSFLIFFAILFYNGVLYGWVSISR